MPTWRPSVNVPKLPNDAVHVGNGNVLHGWVSVEVQRRENRVGAEPRDGEPPAVVRVRRRQHLRERDHRIIFFGAVRVPSVRVGVACWDEADSGEDLVGVGVGEEGDGGHAAEDHRAGGDERGEEGGVRGLLGVALGEVVDGGVDGGDMDGGAGG